MIVVLVLVLVGGGLLLLYLRSVRRRTAFFTARTAEAARLGLHPAVLDPWLAGVADRVFRTHGQAARMVAGPGVRVCDFTSQASATATAAKCHLLAYDLPVALPSLVVEQHNPFVPGQEFESAAFNSAFSVECADPRYASAVLHPQLLEWLLAHPWLEWRIEGGALVAWGVGYWTVPRVQELTSALGGIAERIPPYVLEEYRLR
ncbi:hypothetical protein GCM10009804_41750 [Kribbella hippodromi]|uniref:Uncharacterized protein n=1 Tax=Kribbella hippodromi TaxID=434347 RepID=A0ABN2DQD5_9ACTN